MREFLRSIQFIDGWRKIDKCKQEQAGWIYIEYYAALVYSVWIISGFITISSIDIKSTKITSILKLLSNNIFVVYLGHLPILLFVTEIMTIDSLKAAVMFVVAFFVGLEIFAEILKRLPVLRKLV